MTLYTIPSTFVESRRNLVLNPGFRVGTTGWSAIAGGGGAATLVRQGFGIPGAGVPAALGRLTCTAAGTWFRAACTTLNGAVTAGQAYTISCWYRSAPSATDFRLIIVWRSAGGSVISEVTTPNLPAGATGRFASLTAIAPVGAVRAEIQAGRLSGAVGDFVDIAAVLFERSSAAGEYFDGDTPDTAAADHSWAGTANNSESVLSIPNALSRIDTLATLMPYSATRRSRTVVHTLLDEPVQLFTFRQATLPEGVFEVLIESHTAAYAALNKLSARTAWALYDEADDGPIERWFMVAGQDIEMRQSDQVAEAYVLRVPYVEIESL